MILNKAVILVAGISFSILLALGIMTGAKSLKAQSPVLRDEISAAATTPLLISYQGRLSDASGPITAGARTICNRILL